MFEAFAKYIGDPSLADINTAEELMLYLSEKNILNGMYRVFNIREIDTWNKIVEDAFPAFKNKIKVFAYDWLGRVFALKKEANTVLLFEPGTGDVLDIPVDIIRFHNEEIADHHDASLASGFFEAWFKKNDKYVLSKKECVGYKVPLFLSGDDTLENLEVSDMEVYWGIMSSLLTSEC